MSRTNRDGILRPGARVARLGTGEAVHGRTELSGAGECLDALVLAGFFGTGEFPFVSAVPGSVGQTGLLRRLWIEPDGGVWRQRLLSRNPAAAQHGRGAMPE